MAANKRHDSAIDAQCHGWIALNEGIARAMRPHRRRTIANNQQTLDKLLGTIRSELPNDHDSF